MRSARAGFASSAKAARSDRPEGASRPSIAPFVGQRAHIMPIMPIMATLSAKATG